MISKDLSVVCLFACQLFPVSLKFLNPKLFYRIGLADLVHYSDSMVWSSKKINII